MSGSRKTRTFGFVKLVEILKLVELVKTWSILDKLCKTILLNLVKEHLKCLDLFEFLEEPGF